MKKNKIISALAAFSLFFSVPSNVFAQEKQTLEFEEVTDTSKSEGTEQTYTLDTGSSNNAILVDGTVLDHVYLGTMDLSGMSREEVLACVEHRMDEITGYPIVLHMDDQTVSVPAKELGVTCDYDQVVEDALEYGKMGSVLKRYKIQKQLEEEVVQLDLEYQVEEETLRSALETYCVPLNRKVSDYGLVRKNQEFEVIPGETGMTLKLEESVEKVTAYLAKSWMDGIGNIELEVEVTQPKGSREELSHVTTILGKGSTDYSSSSTYRKKNIENAVSMLNGTLLYPGETLSVCNSIIPFTEENGYYPAASYANGTVVETLGGGICQVSTTLYLAVLRSEIEVVERYNHSMSVSYVKLAMDAAISEGSKDFKIKNNLDVPIYLHAYANGSTVYFAIYGEEYRPEGRTVTFENEVVEEIEATTELKADYNISFGTVEKTQSSHTGYRTKLWKVITENGEETREQVNTSYYRMSPAKYTIGMDSSNKEAVAAMREAIAAGSIQQVYEVINYYGID